MEDKKIVSEEQEFHNIMNKQVNMTRLILLVIFGFIGIIFAIIGAFLLGFNVIDKGIQIGLIFLPIGLGFCLAGLLCYWLIPKDRVYNYERYKQRVEKYGFIDTISMAAMISYHKVKIEQLESRIKELEDKLNNE
ncbi:MAG TPA: hypothetical protein VIL26_08675 [Clostridia bacterium]